MDLSIIIVSWNVKPLLERCLRSIFEYNQEIDYDIWVVDNDSHDNSQEYLRKLEQFKDNLHVIQNQSNLGFAKANNQAARKAKGRFILFLNPDTEFLDNTCQKTVEVMDQAIQKGFKWGVVGIKIKGIDGKVQSSVRSFPTLVSQLIIMLKLHHFLPWTRAVSRYFCRGFDYKKLSEVEQVMGSFLLTSNELLKQLNYLDENFFLWFEEVDYCKRVKQAGRKVIYYPKGEILHYGGESFNQLLPLKKEKIFNQSLIYYFKKHFPLKIYLILKIFSPLSLFLAWLMEIFLRMFPKMKRYF